MFLTDKLSKKLLSDPKVQFQMTLSLMDTLSNHLVGASYEVINNGFSIDDFVSKLNQLSSSVEAALVIMNDETIRRDRDE